MQSTLEARLFQLMKQSNKKLSEEIRRIKDEIAYLRTRRPELVKQYIDVIPGYTQQQFSLKTISELDTALDALNTKLIKPLLKVTVDGLNLERMFITRLPTSLIQDKEYKQFFEDLFILDISGNYFPTLNLSFLKGPSYLYCRDSHISSITLPPLFNMTSLHLEENNLKSLPQECEIKFGKKWCQETLENQSNKLKETDLPKNSNL